MHIFNIIKITSIINILNISAIVAVIEVTIITNIIDIVHIVISFLLWHPNFGIIIGLLFVNKDNVNGDDYLCCWHPVSVDNIITVIDNMLMLPTNWCHVLEHFRGKIRTKTLEKCRWLRKEVKSIARKCFWKIHINKTIYGKLLVKSAAGSFIKSLHRGKK